MKDCNVKINDRNVFDQLVINNIRTYEKIEKLPQSKEITTHDYTYCKESNIIIATDLNKPQVLSAVPKVVQRISFAEHDGVTQCASFLKNSNNLTS